MKKSKKINEDIMLSVGNATSLMTFIDIAYYIEKQKGMLSIAFPSIGSRGFTKLLGGLSQNPGYLDNKDQLLGMSERFYNNSGLKLLYKTLGVLVSKKIPPEEKDARMQDINRVLSKIERMINSKLTNQEKELFTSMEDSIDNYSDKLNSSLNSSIESSVNVEEPAPEEKPTEEPKPEEKPKEEPKADEKPTEKPEEKPAEEPKPEEKPAEEPTEKPKTEEQFRSLIKRLVKETLRDYEKKFGKL